METGATKRVNAILLLVLFLLACNPVYCGTVAAPYEVGNWPGFRSAAITYTFDDGCSNQYSIAIPMFNEPNFGFKLTMYPVTNWGPNWSALQATAAIGHEIGSHTVSHPNLNGMTVEAQTPELVNSKNAINSNIPGQQCVTIAYPYCAPSDLTLTSTYYIAARHCQGYIEPNTPSNFYQISSIICGDQGSVKTAADFTSRFTSAASSKGWCVFLIHGIDGDGGYSPLSSTVLRASLNYLSANRSTFWVSTFSNVARYIRERNDVSVAETSNTGDSITLQVTDTLSNTIYNYPLTMRRPVLSGWGSANVTQNGQSVTSSIVMVDSVAYVMFNAVPDGGDVVLSKGAYGDLTGNGIVLLNDFDVFVDYWPVEDYDFTNWLDFDGDCMIAFHEFAALAENWRQPL